MASRWPLILLLVAATLGGVAWWIATAKFTPNYKNYTVRSHTSIEALMAGVNAAEAGQTVADDPDLAADEWEMGAMWAHAHRPRSASECPRYSAAFRRGCADTLAVLR